MTKLATDDITSEVERIEIALAALLTEMLRHDAKRKGKDGGKLIVVCAADMVPTTRREAQIESLLDNPVRAACKNAIRMLGERLHELGLGLDQMQGVAEWAATEAKGGQFGQRINIIDKTWNDIGSWIA